MFAPFETDMGKRDHRRQLIEEVAMDIVLNEGIFALSVDNIAKRLGMSKSVIYYYFDTKEDIVRSILRKSWKEMTEFLESIVDNDSNLEDVLKKHMEFVQKNLRRVKLMFILTKAVKDEVVEQLIEREKRIYKSLISKEIEKGNLKGNVDHIYEAIAGTVKEVVKKDLSLKSKWELVLDTIERFK